MQGKEVDLSKLALVLAILLMIPLAVFGDWGVGGAAFYKSNNPSANQLGIAGNVRLKLGVFQAEALLLYSGGYSVDVFLDAGLVLDMAHFRLSLGAGQSFGSSLGSRTPIRAGLNAKAGAEVLFGRVSVGISYIMDLTARRGTELAASLGLLGVNLILWM